MSNSWSRITLKECADLIGDGLHGTPNYDENGQYYFINGNNLRDNHIIFDDKTKRVSHEEFLKYKKPLNNQTILISINGTIGNFARYNGENIVLGKSACYLNIKDSINKNFVGFVLKNKDFQNYIRRFATGTTIKNVSLKTIREYAFNLPEKKDQDFIATFLKSFEDKIELNQKMNQTLEDIAKAIFKSWFIDFDPVKAKAEGISIGLPDEISKLFPSEFVDSEIGEVPKGWKIGVLGDLSKFQNGYAFKSKDWNVNGAIPVIKIGNVKPLLVDVDECSKVSEKVINGLARFKLNVGDIVIGMTGYVGEVGMVPIREKMPYLNQRVGKIYPINSIDKWFIFTNCRNAEFKCKVEMLSKGSAQANVSGNEILSIQICIPPLEIRREFERITSPIYENILLKEQQIKCLQNLRDLLLPKLISGEIKILDAEKFLEEVGT